MHRKKGGPQNSKKKKKRKKKSGEPPKIDRAKISRTRKSQNYYDIQSRS